MMKIKSESVESRLWRWGGNLFPAYRRTGARVSYISADFHEVHVEMPCTWKTRNYMGITWGGGLYGALDPIYGVMLYKVLGKKYRVVDRTAFIHFKRPAKTTLFAQFRITEQDLNSIQSDLSKAQKTRQNFDIDLYDKQGLIHVSCKKELSIIKK